MLMTENKVVSLESSIKIRMLTLDVCIFFHCLPCTQSVSSAVFYIIPIGCILYSYCGIFPAHCNLDEKRDDSLPQPYPYRCGFSSFFFHIHLFEPFTHGEARTRTYKTETKKKLIYIVMINSLVPR